MNVRRNPNVEVGQVRRGPDVKVTRVDRYDGTVWAEEIGTGSFIESALEHFANVRAPFEVTGTRLSCLEAAVMSRLVERARMHLDAADLDVLREMFRGHQHCQHAQFDGRSKK